MGKLSNLFKYKKQIDILDPETGKVVQNAWVRVLGDDDLKKAYQYARIVSAERRAVLKDESSDEYRDEIAQLDEVPDENLMSIILAAREADYEGEAGVVAIRGELPKIEEIAAQPDAPTLEDQERLDKLTADVEADYAKQQKEYVQTKMNELLALLKEMTHETLVKTAKLELANIQALDAFVTELNEQKGYRGTFEDEACKIRAFDSIEDFKAAHTLLKSQIIGEYNRLELGSDEVKK